MARVRSVKGVAGKPLRLFKHSTVLHRQPGGDTPNSMYFEPLKDEENQVVEGYHMTLQDFADFGEPEVITVSVEPGDLLQEDL